jgi:hypothetical protein
MGGFWCYFLDFFGLASPDRLHNSRIEPAGQHAPVMARADADRMKPIREEAAGHARVAA